MSEVDATRTLAREHDLEFVELDHHRVDPETATVFSEAIARRHHMVAIERKFGIPVIAVTNPDDIFALDTIRASMGRDFSLVVAPQDQVVRFIGRLYGGDSAPEPPPPASAPAEPSTPLPQLVISHNSETSSALGNSSETSLYGPPLGDNSVNQVPVNGHDVDPPLAGKLGSILDQTPDGLASSGSELSRLAHSVELVNPAGPVDAAAEIADLVDEAVATFEGQLNEPDLLTGATSTFPPLAEALIEGNRVSLDDMQSVLEEQGRTGRSIARILTARKLVTEADLMWGMAREMDLEFVDLDMLGVNFSESELIPEATARHHNVLVISNDNGHAVVAVSNPTDVFAMDDLRTIIGRNFTLVVATRSQINAQIARAYGAGDAAEVAETASLEFDRDDPSAAMDDIQAVTEEAPIVRYVNLLMVQALNERASDIHVEPTATNLRIRLRIDGVLHDVSTAPRSIAAAVTTRLKVMADMNIAEHRIPQDGRISVTIGRKAIDLRMATLPTIYGEKIVMRVLDKSSVVMGFPDLGFDQDLLATYEGIYTKPYGTILVTGPTGSGKSTTLYATISALNSPDKNIITVEDPVEIRLQGVNQVQLNVKAGLTFA
jgi:hypothetical protein